MKNIVNSLIFLGISCFGHVIYQIWLQVEPDKEMLNRIHLPKKPNVELKGLGKLFEGVHTNDLGVKVPPPPLIAINNFTNIVLICF